MLLSAGRTSGTGSAQCLRQWPRRRVTALPLRRRVTAWVLAIGGTAVLAAVLAATRSAHSDATEVMLFLALAVTVALTGGLAPALTCAVLAVAILNFWFTPPLYTWKIAQPEHVLALAVFAAVSVAVSSVVDMAARRSAQAARSRAESETLSALAAGVLRGEDSVAAVLDRLRETFDATSAELLESADGNAWRRVAFSGAPSMSTSLQHEVTLSRNLKLVLGGQGLGTDDERVVTAFAAHTVMVLERERLRARAAETQRLEEGLAIRTALLAAVSHDLRTPLASIKTAASSLRLPNVDWTASERSELVATVEDSTDKLQRLVDNLLDLSRLQAGVVQPVLAPVALDEVVPHAVDGFPPYAVDLDVPEDLPLVLTDPGLLERVIANLVQNAVRHGGGDSHPVKVTARVCGSRVVLRVADHGPGVPDDGKGQMFEAFQRIGDVPRGAGVGLGLAVARGFSSAVSATLEPEDTPGGGLTMALSMPPAPVPT